MRYLRSLRFINSDFADFLTLFRIHRKFINVRADGPHLRICATGPIVHVMDFEIFVFYVAYLRQVFNQHIRCSRGVRMNS